MTHQVEFVMGMPVVVEVRDATAGEQSSRGSIESVVDEGQLVSRVGPPGS